MSLGDISFEEVDQSQFIEGRNGVLAFVGPAQKGVLGSSRLISNAGEFLYYYGQEFAGDDTVSVVLQALRGGAQVRFSRSVHYTDVADPDTKTSVAAFNTINGVTSSATGAVQTTSTAAAFIPAGSSLDVDVDGVVTDVEFTGVAASAVAATPETWDLTGGRTLTLKFDQGLEQTVSVANGDFVDPANATALELATALNDGRMIGGSVKILGGTTLSLVSDTKGSASYVQVTGGTLNADLNWTTTEQASAGPNNVPNLNSVSAEDLYNVLVAEAIADLTLDYTGGVLTMTTDATGSGVYLGFDGDTGIPEKFGWTDGAGGRTTGSDVGATTPAVTITAKEDGTWANTGTIVVTANADDPATFDFAITPPVGTTQGVAPETFRGVDKDSYPSASTHWVFTKVNDVQPAVGSYALAGGDNGLSAMTAATRVGVLVANTGIYGLTVRDFIDLRIPYMTDNTQQIAVKNWAETEGVFYEASIPVGLTPQGGLDFARAEGAYSAGTRIRSSYVSWRFGDLEYIDNRVGDNATTKMYEPSGGMASVFAYNDVRDDSNGNSPGPWLAASGTARGIVAQQRTTRPLSVSYDMAESSYAAIRTSMRQAGVNFFESTSGQVYAKGNRTSSAVASLLRYMNVRRLLLSLRQYMTPVLLGLQDEPHAPPLWRMAYLRLTSVLSREFADKGAFQAGANDPGFLINCDQTARTVAEAVLNTPDYVDQGIFRIQLRVKPVTATEAIDVLITVDSSGVEYEVQGQ